MTIGFSKMSGAGNDFIIVDDRAGQIQLPDPCDWVRQVCRRRISVGADGLIFIRQDERLDFQWQFFNADGSVAEMCGNGARCAARFAYRAGIAVKTMRFGTQSGVIHARIVGDEVAVLMPTPVDLRGPFPIAIGDGLLTGMAINTGVPHVVILADHLDTVDVAGVGRAIRRHPDFAPAGTNVNFIESCPDGEIRMRTYERGIEAETLACGTGAVAVALTEADRTGRTSPITVCTHGGGQLGISFESNNGKFSSVWLRGDARFVYDGQLHPDALIALNGGRMP